MTSSPAAQRILASTARRGAGLIREAAYLAAVLRVTQGGSGTSTALVLFAGRHRFTPGWSSRTRVGQWRAFTLEPFQPAQDAPGRPGEYARLLEADARGELA